MENQRDDPFDFVLLNQNIKRASPLIPHGMINTLALHQRKSRYFLPDFWISRLCSMFSIL